MNRSRLALFLPAIALAASLLIGPWNTGSPATTAVAQTSCDPYYPDFCLPVFTGTDNINCTSPEVQGFKNFRALEPDPYSLDESGVGDGVACEDPEGTVFPPPTASPTNTPTATSTLTATATIPATSTPTATPTSPPTATSTTAAATATSPATIAATQAAAATPKPPTTGGGTSSGDGAPIALFALAGLAFIGAAGFLVARRRA